MQTERKLAFIILFFGLILYFGKINFVRAEDTPDNNLQFCVDAGKLYFFQPDSGRIFVYQLTTNRFSQLLTLEKLGEDLKQSRSLSVIKPKAETRE